MWTLAFALAVLPFQDEMPAPQLPLLTVEEGKFAPLDASEDKAVGIDLASIKPHQDGLIGADAYFYNEEPEVTPVAGVAFSSVLPTYMMKAALSVDCSTRQVRVAKWSRLTDLGYSVLDIPSTSTPIVPQPFSDWNGLVHTICSPVEQARLPVMESYTLFHQRMASMQANLALRRLPRR